MAEHNGNYSASFKNVFDWCTRISGKVFQKSMLLMASSQGLKVVQALEIAKKAFPFYGGNIKATFHSSFDVNFDNKC
jgi:NAD(P)H-dependent FMN reductase